MADGVSKPIQFGSTSKLVASGMLGASIWQPAGRTISGSWLIVVRSYAQERAVHPVAEVGSIGHGGASVLQHLAAIDRDP